MEFHRYSTFFMPFLIASKAMCPGPSTVFPSSVGPQLAVNMSTLKKVRIMICIVYDLGYYFFFYEHVETFKQLFSHFFACLATFIEEKSVPLLRDLAPAKRL